MFGLSPVTSPVDAGPSIDARDVVGDGAADGPSSCPESYDLPIDGSPSRYRYVADGTTWTAAQAACAADSVGGTHLIVFDDDGERLGLMAALATRGIVASVWIGLTDRKTEDVFLWVTAQEVGMPPLSTPPWGAGQPDDQNGVQDCVRVVGAGSTGAGLFDDGECSSVFAYVCECDGYAPEPNNY